MHRHLSLSRWGRSIRSTAFPTNLLTIHFVVLFHLCLNLPSCLFLPDFPTKSRYAPPLLSPIRATCSAHLIFLNFFFTMAKQPPVAKASSVEDSWSHAVRHTTLGRTSLAEWSARRRDLYLTTHNTHNRQTSMCPARFEPATPASERPQTHALDHAAYGVGFFLIWSPETYLVRNKDLKSANYAISFRTLRLCSFVSVSAQSTERGAYEICLLKR